MLVNDVDKEKGAMPSGLRIPYMEVNGLMGPDVDKIPFPADMVEVMTNPISFAGKMSSPRVLKTHLPINCLPHGKNTSSTCYITAYVIQVCRQARAPWFACYIVSKGF